VREVIDEVINDAHVIVGIDPGKLYPVAAEDLGVGEGDSEIQGNTEE
jgi:hypothetical protein